MEFINKNPKIYVLSGKAEVGKNFVANFIKDIYYKKNKKAIIIAYASTLKEYAKNILDWDGEESSKPRDFLQQVGVELIKNQIDDHMLIKRLIDDIKVYSYFYDVIIISDARFVEEICEIKNKFDNVTTININSNNESSLNENQKNHITEIALDDFNDYDYVIVNDSTSYDLKGKVNKIIEEVDNNE